MDLATSVWPQIWSLSTPHGIFVAHAPRNDGTVSGRRLRFSSTFCIKLNNKLCLQENAGKLFCARARAQHATRFGGEDFTMADKNPNALQNEEAKKLRAYQRDRDMQRRGVKIDDAVKGISDDDRKTIINKSLRKVNSALSVS
jgi:hypothetical protein